MRLARKFQETLAIHGTVSVILQQIQQNGLQILICCIVHFHCLQTALLKDAWHAGCSPWKINPAVSPAHDRNNKTRQPQIATLSPLSSYHYIHLAS